ncbi:MAG: NAD(P)H-dependent oxidoreductase subunit E, partial [Bacteroidia bacterium]|nr:NAD(P)H-dependent oxidoreductase subunit E [Bacteroidia bacterium]
MSENLSELLGRKGLNENLFDELGRRAKPSGTPENKDMEALAEKFLIGSANTYGTASFYDFLKPDNKGKSVYVCNGTACLCAGTQNEVVASLKDHFADSEIGHMTCLGRCHENSAFHYNGKNYSGSASKNLDKIIDCDSHLNKDDYRIGNNGQSILTGDFTSIDDYYKPFLEALKKDSTKVLEEIKISNLRGRGGAGFPMGLKLEFCRNEASDTKFIICNADEGDPGAYSDRYLLEKQPHAVLFGMLISGYVTGASHGILYIRAEYPEAVELIQQAIDDLSEQGFTGENIKGCDFDFDFKIIQAQGSYICGEETALINSIEGQRPEVRVRPPYPAQKGLFNKPTVVNNVETLAALHFIIENGGKAWRSIGTENSSGTKLVCLDSFFNNPGLFEIEMGTP